MADYLSRHPSEYEGSVAKAEELFNDWFTVNVVKEITPELLKRLADQCELIRAQENLKAKQRQNSRVFSVHAPMQTNSALESLKVDNQLLTMAAAKYLPNSKISSVYAKANAENDRVIQNVISLVHNKSSAVIARLNPPRPPGREKFISFSVDSNGQLYMDHRLVIPKDMRHNMLRTIHFRERRNA